MTDDEASQEVKNFARAHSQQELEDMMLASYQVENQLFFAEAKTYRREHVEPLLDLGGGFGL